jgi:hypothetical protein
MPRLAAAQPCAQARCPGGRRWPALGWCLCGGMAWRMVAQRPMHCLCFWLRACISCAFDCSTTAAVHSRLLTGWAAAAGPCPLAAAAGPCPLAAAAGPCPLAAAAGPCPLAATAWAWGAGHTRLEAEAEAAVWPSSDPLGAGVEGGCQQGPRRAGAPWGWREPACGGGRVGVVGAAGRAVGGRRQASGADISS